MAVRVSADASRAHAPMGAAIRRVRADGGPATASSSVEVIDGVNVRRWPRATRLVGVALAVGLMATVSPSPTPSAADESLPIRPAVLAVGDIAPDVRLHGAGWGHGVGMSQYGAYGQALDGASVTDILTHYYPGTEVGPEPRAGTDRIRVGLRTGADATLVRAVDGPVAWRACDTDDLTQRAPDAACEPWFEQAAGDTVVACPAMVSPDATDPATDPATTPTTDTPDTTDTPGVAVAGIAVHQVPAGTTSASAAVCAGEPWQVAARPVARADHGEATIQADSHDGQLRSYRFGWRDLHHLDSGLSVVQDVSSVDRYLRGLAEVPNSWGFEGPAALEAQAVTGRTFALRRIDAPRGGDCACDLLATPADQVFIGEDKVLGLFGELWAAAVADSAELVLRYDGGLAQTFYSSSHGGRSENIEDSWAYGTTPVPYLRSVDDRWSSDPRVLNSRASWDATVPNAELAAFVSSGRDVALARLDRFVVRSRTDGGTPRVIDIAGVTASGEPATIAFDGRPSDPKPIAGASLRRYLPVSDGGTGGRLNSSQIVRIGFAPFVDDDGSTHERAITWAATAGIVQGVDDDRFAPGQPVTRAQLATFLVNTFAIPPAAPDGVFDDVPASSTHADAIAALAATGITTGFEDGTFRPGEPVSRQQLASFLDRALALPAATSTSFSDVRAANVHREAIEALAASGIARGCEVDRFCPAEPVLRGQLASFLSRVVLG